AFVLSKRHWAILGLALIISITALLSTLSPASSDEQRCSTTTPNAPQPPIFKNMNDLTITDAAAHNDLVLVTILIKTDELKTIPALLSLLSSLSYPLDKLDLAFMLTDPTSGSKALLEHMLLHNKNKFRSVSAYAKTISTSLGDDKDSVYELQPLIRSALARARNYLIKSALRDEHKWILALDNNVHYVPSNIIEQLMDADVDVVVPNCMVQRSDGLLWGFDKSNWRETEVSNVLVEDFQQDFVLLEASMTKPPVGFWQLQTHRLLLIDMPTTADRHAKIPLDGIGSCFSLSKAHVHRTGVIYPPFPYRRAIDTEGFAQMAKASGFGVYGLPGVQVQHAPEP
ncbi:hypothetical protein INT43_008228, partial [Umbelopsis isabellina]